MTHNAASLSLALLSLALAACHDGRGGREPAGGSTPIVESQGQGVEGEASRPAYPGTLIASSELGPDFMARQKLSGTHGDQQFRFEAVLQLRGGVLTVVGLTPFNAKAFVLEQTGTEVEFQQFLERELPFPPQYILQDIHRTWFWHQRLPWGDHPGEESPQAEVEGERVHETWQDGSLVRRTFERLDGAPAGLLRIDYVGGHRSGKPAPHVVIDNAWFGYRLEIETAQWRAL
jgi:hypothetical protein